jgi:hypothetical protein
MLAYALALYADAAGWERSGETITAFEAWWDERKRQRQPFSAITRSREAPARRGPPAATELGRDGAAARGTGSGR